MTGLPEVRLLVERRRVTPAGCWEWTGATNGYGYGLVFIRGRKHYTHRLAYQLAEGAIPVGLVIDHLCENPICFNPIHLDAVTHRENLRRASKVGGKSHCVHGHEYTPENTYITPAGSRQCRTCNKRRWREQNARRRQESKL